MTDTRRPEWRQQGSRLRNLRLEAGLTQAQLAEKARIDRVSIVNMENGRRGIGPKSAERLGDALGVPADVFALPETERTDWATVPRRLRELEEAVAQSEEQRLELAAAIDALVETVEALPEAAAMVEERRRRDRGGADTSRGRSRS